MRILVFFLVGLAAVGCSHTYRVTSSDTGNAISVESLNEFLRARECTIFMKDDTVRNAVHVAVTSTSINWQVPEKPVEESRFLSQVNRIEVCDKTRGFVDAMFVGTVGAAMLVFMGPRGGGSFLVAPAYPEAAAVFVLSAGLGAFSSSTRKFLILNVQ